MSTPDDLIRLWRHHSLIDYAVACETLAYYLDDSRRCEELLGEAIAARAAALELERVPA